jgi:hypothetical protein
MAGSSQAGAASPAVAAAASRRPGSGTPRSGGSTLRGTHTAAAAGAGGRCRRSVTSLVFLPSEHSLVSSSDMDGVVKVWDLRRQDRPAGAFTLPAPARTAGRASSSSSSSRRGGSTAAAGGVGDEDEAGSCWLSLNCPSRTNTRPAGITSISLSPAGGLGLGFRLAGLRV